MIELDKIYNTDCLEALRQLPDKCVDLVVTDPPYRTISGGTNSKWSSGWSNSVLSKNDGKIFANNDIKHKDWIREVFRVLKDDSHAYFMTNLINLFNIKDIAEKEGFVLHNLLVWEKNTANANRWYMKNCEYTLFFRKGNAKTINNPSSKTVHSFVNPVGNKLHPTEKPIELMQFYISNSSKQGDIILDPFMGSGTTAVAAKQLNRHFIGYEIDKTYYNTALRRIAEQQTNLFDNK